MYENQFSDMAQIGQIHRLKHERTWIFETQLYMLSLRRLEKFYDGGS